MSIDDWSNGAAGFDDDNVWSNDLPTENNSEQDITVPDFSEQEIQELKHLDPVVSTPNSIEDSDARSDTQGKSQGRSQGGNSRKRRRGYNQEYYPPPYYWGNFNGPRFAWGMGYGPSGPGNIRRPWEQMVIKYLIGCGVPREQLQNLPRDLLQLIEPEHCGVCNMHLESYNTSRVHYLSKGHFKKQLRWKSSEVGFQRENKEQSLKPRDVYCELCNVQITSKVHADSHYSGKPHRAIVEGRKQPKNHRLLNKGMKHRVEMLINREKLNQHVPVEVDQEDALKSIQPELYCEICKTSVTCTEQMRSHLNGKRHLAKEKNYILKMMQGDINDDKQDGDEDCKDRESQEEQGGDDVDDWGNGSGAWEDPQ